MYIATNGDRKIGLHDDVQAAAYRGSGWDVRESTPATDETATAGAGGSKASELEALKEEASTLGLTIHPNIGYEKLLAKVEEARLAATGADGE